MKTNKFYEANDKAFKKNYRVRDARGRPGLNNLTNTNKLPMFTKQGINIIEEITRGYLKINKCLKDKLVVEDEYFDNLKEKLVDFNFISKTAYEELPEEKQVGFTKFNVNDNGHPYMNTFRKLLENKNILDNVVDVINTYIINNNKYDIKTKNIAKEAMFNDITNYNINNMMLENNNINNVDKKTDTILANKFKRNLDLIKNINNMSYDIEHSILQIPDKDRTIVDINSDRYLNGIADIILTPQLDAADGDRVRRVKANIQKYNQKIEQIAADAHNPDILKNKVKNYNNTLQQFMAMNDDPNVLINITDVIYYINDADLYAMAEKLNDGTIATGLIHIPKFYDGEKHNLIVGGSIEGYAQVLLNKAVDPGQPTVHCSNFDFIMRAQGNRYDYNSCIRFLPLLNRTQYILKAPNDFRGDYILKIVKKNAIDLNATDYIAFDIQKITNPTIRDLATEDIRQNQKLYLELLEQIQLSNAIQNKIRYLTEFINDKIDYTLPNPLYKIDDEPQPEDEPIEIIPRKTVYTIITKHTGRVFNYSRKMECTREELMGEIQETNLDQIKVNKLDAKILTLEEIGDEQLRALVVYINREFEKLTIHEIIALLTHRLINIAKAETKLAVLKSLKLVQNINDLKNNKYTTLPTSLFDAFVKNKLKLYIGNKIKDWLHINENANETEQDFC